MEIVSTRQETVQVRAFGFNLICITNRILQEQGREKEEMCLKT